MTGLLHVEGPLSLKGKERNIDKFSLNGYHTEPRNLSNEIIISSSWGLEFFCLPESSFCSYYTDIPDIDLVIIQVPA